MEDVAADAPGQARGRVGELYVEHALGLVRLAVVMLGDRAGAEDVVQDAFLGLYRRWENLTDPAKALTYVRSAVLNGCRTVLRQRDRGRRLPGRPALGAPADESVLLSEEYAQVLAAIRRLPDRQREAVVLRFYLDMDEAQAAEAMGVSRGTVKSATSRSVAALGRMLQEEASS